MSDTTIPGAERGEPIDVPEQADPCVGLDVNGLGTTQFGMQPCQVAVGVPPTYMPFLPETGSESAGGGVGVALLVAGIVLLVTSRSRRR